MVRSLITGPTDQPASAVETSTPESTERLKEQTVLKNKLSGYNVDFSAHMSLCVWQHKKITRLRSLAKFVTSSIYSFYLLM